MKAASKFKSTMRRESQLGADDRGIFIVPVVITHCPIPPSNTHLHSAPGQLILDEEVILGLVDGDVELRQIANSQSYIKFCTISCGPGTESISNSLLLSLTHTC